MIKLPRKNVPLVEHIYTADPSVHVFEGKLYIYPSHDIDHDNPPNNNGDEYIMEDYHVLSMDGFNAPVVDHGQVLHMNNVPWVKKQMWAPDAAYKNNTYYLYFPARDHKDIFRIGVATSKSPQGPFKPLPNFIDGSFSIDPAVFVDDDNRSYMYFGGLWGGQLEKWRTNKFFSDGVGPELSEPAIGPRFAELNDDMISFKESPQEITIIDENGQPVLAGDEDKRYFEGPWVHKYNGYYYLSYSTGTTRCIVYAISKNPQGPFVYKGKILTPVIGWTTHHSIVEYKGKWYIFYHDSHLSSGVFHKRCIKFTELYYNEDGTIQTINPYK